jgi:hypothetical protein
MSDPTGQPQATSAASLHAAPTVSSAGALSILKSAISVSQMVLFAFGPGGVIAAAGLEVFGLCFGSDGGKPVNLPKTINDLVVQDFANDHVMTDLATIIGYTKWMAMQNPSAISAQMPDKEQKRYQDSLDELKGHVRETCGPGSHLLAAISNLQNAQYDSDPPYKLLGLPTLLLGAFLHLTFLKARLLLSTDATTFRSPQARELAGFASDYLDYLKARSDDFEKAYGHRLNGVSMLIQGDFIENVGDRRIKRHYVYITDSRAGEFPKRDIVWPSMGGPGWAGDYAKNIVWFNVCGSKGLFDPGSCDDGDIAPGKSWRQDYMAGLWKDLDEKYNYGPERIQEYATCAAELKKIVEAYGAAGAAR